MGRVRRVLSQAGEQAVQSSPVQHQTRVAYRVTVKISDMRRLELMG